MLAATLIAVFIIPVLFVSVEKISRRRAGVRLAPAATPPLPAHRGARGGDPG
jgi:hypothetical protein